MHMHYAMVKVRERSYFQLKKGASSKCWIVTGGKIHLRHATLPSTMHGDLHIRVVLTPITVLPAGSHRRFFNVANIHKQQVM